MSYKHWMGLSLCFALAACATTGRPAPAVSAQAAGNEPPPGCVAETATRLPLSAHQCAAFGHTWTQQDVRNTGATDVGQALRLLDPSITSTH